MKKLKVLKYLICTMLLIAILTVLGFVIVYIKLNSYFLPYKSSELLNIEYEIKRPENVNYQTLTEDIDEMFNYPSYNLTFTDFTGSVKGKCYIFSREIILDENLNYEYYTFCLVHELVHLTELTYNERYTNLKAFNKLYNSGNEYFKNIALYFANLDLNGAFTEEYSFVGYIEL